MKKIVKVILAALLLMSCSAFMLSCVVMGTDGLTFPAGVQKIEAHAFAGTDADVIVLPETVKELDPDAFQGIGHSATVVLPSSFSSVQYTMARDWYSLCVFYMENGTTACKIYAPGLETVPTLLSGWERIDYLSPAEVYAGETELDYGLRSVIGITDGVSGENRETYTFFVTREGVYQNGWVYADGKVYYMETDRRAGPCTRDGSYDYLSEDGSTRNAYFTFDETGAVTSELPADMMAVTTAGLTPVSLWEQMGKEPASDLRGLVRRDGEIYIYDNRGNMLRSGWYQADGDWYYLDEDGTARTSAWLFGDDGDYRYVKADGTMARSEWVDDKGLRYVDETGHRLLGVHIVDGVTCYFDTNTAALMKVSDREPDTSLQYYNGKAFIFDADGIRLRSGWYQADGDWYYLNDNATGVVKCWRLKDGKYRYLKVDGTMAHDEWVQDYGDWYYCKSDGSRYESAWAQIGGEWYWFGGSGKMMKNGWLRLADGYWYYFNPSGAMAANRWVQTGGLWYYVGEDGAMLTNTTTPDGYYVDMNGVWR